MKNLVDGLLNYITMYRLVMYYLLALLVSSLGLDVLTAGPHDPMAFVLSAIVISGVCWLTNRLMAWVLQVPVNAESVWITALILILVMPPANYSDALGIAGLAFASVVAIASKFLLAIRGQHIFNPVAIGVVASAVILDQPATWWVGGNMMLLPIVLIGGLFVVRKVQRFAMLGVYGGANILATLLATSPDMYGEALYQTLIYSPLLFAGFAMLTEPLTAPRTKWWSLAYGAVVGVLSSPSIHVGEFYLTPELAFLVGNVLAYVVSPKGRFKLTLLRVEEIASGCYNFVFSPNRKLVFQAGQYLDWTIDVSKSDNRGNRRPFTIASSPSDNEVHLGVKFYDKPSAFKRKLLNMQTGDMIYGSQLAGEFTLPLDKTEKLVFIAGGIGVTPFCSMMQDMLDHQEERPVVMLYGNNTVNDVAYSEVFERAELELGMRTVYAVADTDLDHPNLHHGFIDAKLIQREVPDYSDRTFYVSGPRSMVVKFERILKDLGVSRSRIKVDFFPGFA